MYFKTLKEKNIFININYPYSVFENENELIEEILKHNKNEI